jgi:hypothetical protein
MAHYTLQYILELDRIKRLNIINSVTGIKPANLIGTISEDGKANLAIFSSVVHLGSNPPLLITPPPSLKKSCQNLKHVTSRRNIFMAFGLLSSGKVA